MKSEEWRNLLVLMTTCGYRPEELPRVEAKVNPATNKLALWCSHKKFSGGSHQKVETETRCLQGAPLRDAEGNNRLGNLAAAIHSNLLKLPPLQRHGEAIYPYLHHQLLWQQ